MANETFGRVYEGGQPAFTGRVSDRVGSYFPWVALGAVAVGTVGALVGLMRQTSRRRLWPTWKVTHPDDLTPPHGDKLLSH